MSIATRTGDNGTTALVFGRRVSKAHPRVEAYGTVDELAAVLGMARVELGADDPRQERFQQIQRNLIALSTELAVANEDRERFVQSKMPRVGAEDLQRLDERVAELESTGTKFEGWALPGDSRLGAQLHLARTICRRAERAICRVEESGEQTGEYSKRFLNRLSDLLWLLAAEADRENK